MRVVAVEGVLLEVEPEAGGARDYRDRSGRHSIARGVRESDENFRLSARERPDTFRALRGFSGTE